MIIWRRKNRNSANKGCLTMSRAYQSLPHNRNTSLTHKHTHSLSLIVMRNNQENQVDLRIWFEYYFQPKKQFQNVLNQPLSSSPPAPPPTRLLPLSSLFCDVLSKKRTPMSSSWREVMKEGRGGGIYFPPPIYWLSPKCIRSHDVNLCYSRVPFLSFTPSPQRLFSPMHTSSS